jgi:hypothetical protein
VRLVGEAVGGKSPGCGRLTRRVTPLYPRYPAAQRALPGGPTGVEGPRYFRARHSLVHPVVHPRPAGERWTALCAHVRACASGRVEVKGSPVNGLSRAVEPSVEPFTRKRPAPCAAGTGRGAVASRHREAWVGGRARSESSTVPSCWRDAPRGASRPCGERGRGRPHPLGVKDSEPLGVKGCGASPPPREPVPARGGAGPRKRREAFGQHAARTRSELPTTALPAAPSWCSLLSPERADGRRPRSVFPGDSSGALGALVLAPAERLDLDRTLRCLSALGAGGDR